MRSIKLFVNLLHPPAVLFVHPIECLAVCILARARKNPVARLFVEQPHGVACPFPNVMRHLGLEYPEGCLEVLLPRPRLLRGEALLSVLRFVAWRETPTHFKGDVMPTHRRTVASISDAIELFPVSRRFCSNLGRDDPSRVVHALRAKDCVFEDAPLFQIDLLGSHVWCAFVSAMFRSSKGLPTHCRRWVLSCANAGRFPARWAASRREQWSWERRGPFLPDQR